MAEQRVLDLAGGDVLASPPDHLLVAAGQRDVAVGVDETGVARVQPAALQELGREVGRAPVAGGQHRVSEPELPGDPGGDFRAAVGIDHAQLVCEAAGGRLARTADGARLGTRGRALGAAEGVLAHPVTAHDANAKALFQGGSLRRRSWGRRRVDGAQPRRLPGRHGLALQHREHGPHHVH